MTAVLESAFGSDPASPVPALRPDLTINDGARTRDGSPSWLIHDPVRNRFISIGWLEFEMLKRWSLGSPTDISEAILEQTPLDIIESDVAEFAQFARENDLTLASTSEDAGQIAERNAARKTALKNKGLQRRIYFRLPLFKPNRFLEATLPFARAMTSRPALVILAVLGILGLYLVNRQWSQFVQSFAGLISWQSAPLILVALGITKCFHELGHAWATKHYGLSVPTMGVAFFVVWPFLYTDTTDAWRLTEKRPRLAVGAAGMAAELYIALASTFVWGIADDGNLRDAAFFLASASWMMTLAINANPFMRWDGYYLLSDAIQIENLHGRSFAFGVWKLRELLFGFGEDPPETQTPSMRRFLIGYAWATWAYRVILFTGIALLAYNFLFKVLGIIAMVLAILWFIAGPLITEFKAWHERRKLMKLNLNLIISVCLLAGLVAVLLVPWQRHVAAPAVVQSQTQKEIFAPTPGRLVSIGFKAGDFVTSGQKLVEVQSDSLNFESALAAVKAKRYRSALTRQSTEDFLEQRDVLQEKLVSSQTEQAGLDQQRQSLIVVADFEGHVVHVNDAAVENQWISDSEPLATIANLSNLEVVAYVDEVHLTRLSDAGSAKFFPEDPAVESIDLDVVEISTARVQILASPALASTAGGAIEVKDEEDLEPVKSLYPVRLKLRQTLPSQLAGRISRGTVHLEAESASLLAAGARHVVGVFRREAGF